MSKLKFTCAGCNSVQAMTFSSGRLTCPVCGRSVAVLFSIRAYVTKPHLCIWRIEKEYPGCYDACEIVNGFACGAERIRKSQVQEGIYARSPKQAWRYFLRTVREKERTARKRLKELTYSCRIAEKAIAERGQL